MFKQTKYQANFLVQWNTRLCRDLTEPLVDKVVEAVLYNQGISFEHTSEYRNIYSYEKLWDSLNTYEPGIVKNELDAHMKAGLNRSFKTFALPTGHSKLKPVSLVGTAAELFDALEIRKDTSSGLTAYGETKFEAFTVGLDKAVKILTEGKSPAPCLAGVRTQRKGKTRLVWGYPLEMTIIEAIIARPIINYFKGADHLMSFGKTSHEIGTKMRASQTTTQHFYSIDYSHFDSTVRSDAIRSAFRCFRTWFDLSELVYGNVTVAEIFDLVERYFITTPIVMPSREHNYPTLILGKKSGVPSGSYFTQIVDSFSNAAILFGVADRFKFTVLDKNVYILGDDCLFFTDSLLNLARISNYVNTFGYLVNAQKCSTGFSNQAIEYLGRTWRNGFPLRSWSKAIRGALYPERFRKYSTNAGVRQMEALNVLSSYLLTSYIEDCPIGTADLCNVYAFSGHMTSGFSKYLMSEGLIPGKVLKRAIY